MGSRFPSHRLSNGLYVSGRPEQAKEKSPTMSSTAVPYTGGDVKKSGELGKMFEAHVENSKSRKSGPINAPARSGSFAGATAHSGQMPNPNVRSSYPSGPVPSAAIPGSGSTMVTGGSKRSRSGPLNKHGEPIKKSSGPQSGSVTPMVRQNSGPLPPMLPTTGLIISGPVSSGPLYSSGVSRKISGSLDSTGPAKMHNTSQNQAVTNLSHAEEHSFTKNFPKSMIWLAILLSVMGFIAAAFILAAVHNPIVLIIVVVIFCVGATIYTWNSCWDRRGMVGFIRKYPDTELRSATDGQYVKVSGVVTCGNVPLESSFHKVPRCVYTSTRLYEYRGWDSKPANSQHRCFTWGLRSVERHVSDFYISDFQSGLRALVKTGHGVKVTPYVEESVVIDINPNNKDLSPQFHGWLAERNLSSDDRVMRLKEGYIKEGSSASVMGVVQRNDNVLMIVPPSEPLPTGCQWSKCLLPTSLDGIVLHCEDTSKLDVIPV